MGRSTMAVLMLSGALLLPVSPATASCAEDSGPDGAPVIFVGTADAERRGYTRFEVEEVWTGPDLAPEVWVLSGQEQAPWPLNLISNVSSSTDASFVEGRRYVVGASESFATGACAISTKVRSNPAARAPVEDGDRGADPPAGPLELALWAVGFLALIAAAVGLVRTLRRRKRPVLTSSA
jgi:hypothetical protein